MRDEILFSELVESLYCVNSISNTERELITEKLNGMSNLNIIKDNEEESNSYPYASYTLTAYDEDDNLVIEVCVNVDSDVSLNELSEDKFPEVFSVDVERISGKWSYSYNESCNIEK